MLGMAYWVPTGLKKPVTHSCYGFFSVILPELLCSGVPREGGGYNISLCGICDVTFSYIYTNAIKRVLYLSYLVSLDCFSYAFT